MDYALKLENVTKTYKKSDFILDRVSFALPAGTVMGFVGENGAGKTTTMGCILNTLSKDSGSIYLFGREMKDEDTELREDIGVVYDGDNFPGYLTASQLSGIMSGIYSRWDEELFQKYLKDFHLDKDQKISKYSRGMTMKLAIAAALSHHPKLLILDEATSGLDSVMREEMLDIFLDFVGTEDHSILLSSHITSDLEKIADYITFIHKGRIILTERKDSLLYDYGILRCREKEFAGLETQDVAAYYRRDYQIDVLVSDKRKAQRKYPGLICDTPTIDEIMVILVKGERK